MIETLLKECVKLTIMNRMLWNPGAFTFRLRKRRKRNFARYAASFGRFLNWLLLRSRVSKNLKWDRLPFKLQILLFCKKSGVIITAAHRNHSTRRPCTHICDVEHQTQKGSAVQMHKQHRRCAYDKCHHHLSWVWDVLAEGTSKCAT